MSPAAPARTARPSRAAGRPTFSCSECGWTTAKWVGRCGECQEWGTVTEAAGPTAGPRTAATSPARTPARPIDQIPVESARAVPTGVAELDRVLGGGLVPGAVVLLAGEPGVGKSTLLLDVASIAATGARTVLYVTGEESAGQVRLRAERIGALSPSLLLAAETDLGTVLGHIEATDPDLLVLDSVQTIASAQVEGGPGGVAQVKEVATAIIAAAKGRDMPVLLVGHVTKDGSVAGPRTLEHLVDVVCQFEGDRHSSLRMVRSTKNRYGATDEVGCFELTESGIVGLTDPSGLFLSHTLADVPGTCVTITLEGRRPLPLEVQSLAVPTTLANPRRTTNGIDSSRVAMILAVMHRFAGLRADSQDMYVSTIGGLRVAEPSADLAIALAAASAVSHRAVSRGTVAVGEVGLSGELRPVAALGRRLAEAARLGFHRAIVPQASFGTLDQAPEGMTVLPAVHVAQAAEIALGAVDAPA